MVELLAEAKGEGIWLEYLPALLKEYRFWMEGLDSMLVGATKRVVTLENNHVMNRYYDNTASPRAEVYGTDLECAEESDRPVEDLFLDLRAACESGWDFSSRWLRDSSDLTTIHTTEIIPVDLNCLLYHLEKSIAKAYKNQDEALCKQFRRLARLRKLSILQVNWSDAHHYFMDYDFVQQESKSNFTLAGMYPLFFKFVSSEQAAQCAEVLSQRLLRDGGLVTTEINSGQQWDAPNGWAPLQWMCIKGLRNYGFDELADKISQRWLDLNTKIFKATGKLLEKYNVEDIDLATGGGEYPVQDGFGWTNGVFLKLSAD